MPVVPQGSSDQNYYITSPTREDYILAEVRRNSYGETSFQIYGNLFSDEEVQEFVYQTILLTERFAGRLREEEVPHRSLAQDEAQTGAESEDTFASLIEEEEAYDEEYPDDELEDEEDLRELFGLEEQELNELSSFTVSMPARTFSIPTPRVTPFTDGPQPDRHYAEPEQLQEISRNTISTEGNHADRIRGRSSGSAGSSSGEATSRPIGETVQQNVVRSWSEEDGSSSN